MEELNDKAEFLDIPPANPTGWEIMGKTIIGLVMGVLISFLIFIIITMLGKDLFIGGASVFVPIILALIAFIGTFIGNSAIGGSYNLFYGNKYYDFGKMFGLILLANGLLLLLLTPVYFIFGSQGDAPFMILAFHIFFSVYVTQTFIETFTNPNYAGSSMMGTLISFSVGIIIYLLIYSATYTSPDKIFYLMMTPAIIAFGITPLIHSLWEKIYYRFYEVGNNFLYLPSLQEVEVTEEEMTTNTEDEEDGVNVDL